MTAKTMTLEECKNAVAVEQGFKDWDDYSNFMFHTKVSASKRKLAEELYIKRYARECCKASDSIKGG
jgi:hypothetical protein